MKYTYAVSGVIALLLIATVFCAMPAARAEIDIGVGDYWEYSMDMEDDGMTMDGSFKIKVDSESTVASQQVFILEISGSGDLSGDFDGETISGSFDVSGHQTRVKSDFNVMSETVEIEMSMSAMGITIPASFGFETEYEPSADTFIGDDDMSLDSVVSTTMETTETTWMDMLTMNESDSDTFSQTITMTVVETNVSRTVPAGTFECCKIRVDVVTDGYPDSTEYWYYSDEVGYYVEMGAGSLGSEGSLELEDYSGRDGGLAGLFSGSNLLIMILIIVVAVVLIAVLLGMRSRRGKAPAPMQPLQPGPETPPPSPWQPPAPPGDQSPPPPGYPPVG